MRKVGLCGESRTVRWSERRRRVSTGLCADPHGGSGDRDGVLDYFARSAVARGPLLDLISQPGGEPQLALEALLRGASYTGALLSGAPWTVAEAHQRALRGWGTYQRNELLSVSLQGLFAAVLRAIERDAQGRRRPRPGPSRRHDA